MKPQVERREATRFCFSTPAEDSPVYLVKEGECGAIVAN